MPPSIPDISASALQCLNEHSIEPLAMNVCQSIIMDMAIAHRAQFTPDVRQILDDFEATDFDVELDYNYLSWFPKTQTAEIEMLFAPAITDYVDAYQTLQNFSRDGIQYTESTDLENSARIHFRQQSFTRPRLLITNTSQRDDWLHLAQSLEKALKEVALFPRSKQRCWETLNELTANK